MSEGLPHFSEHGHGVGTGSLAFASTESNVTLVTTGQDGRIRIWDDRGDLIRESDASTNDGGFYSLAVSPDGTFLAVGNGNSVQVTL